MLLNNVGLPHNATMGRGEILQQTPLKLLILQTLKQAFLLKNERY
ncbi:cag pathogenicity island protein [Helicobacter pylori]|nr:cag pathogenicity island protein [Helicobacter pylori]MDU9763721.1 cag pathogenicity island protein [Helicobacter pylori]